MRADFKNEYVYHFGILEKKLFACEFFIFAICRINNTLSIGSIYLSNTKCQAVTLHLNTKIIIPSDAKFLKKNIVNSSNNRFNFNRFATGERKFEKRTIIYIIATRVVTMKM